METSHVQFTFHGSYHHEDGTPNELLECLYKYPDLPESISFLQVVAEVAALRKLELDMYIRLTQIAVKKKLKTNIFEKKNPNLTETLKEYYSEIFLLNEAISLDAYKGKINPYDLSKHGDIPQKMVEIVQEVEKIREKNYMRLENITGGIGYFQYLLYDYCDAFYRPARRNYVSAIESLNSKPSEQD